jgi:hypothetical protein
LFVPIILIGCRSRRDANRRFQQTSQIMVVELAADPANRCRDCGDAGAAVQLDVLPLRVVFGAGLDVLPRHVGNRQQLAL